MKDKHQKQDRQPRERMTFAERKSRGKLNLVQSQNEANEFQSRWVSDRAGRIAELEASGYERDTRQIDGGTVRHGGTHDGGSPMKMVLMRQRREAFDEDQLAKREENDRLMSQIKEKPLEGGAAKEISAVENRHGRITESSAQIEVG